MEGGFAQQLASLQRAASRATNQADQSGAGGGGTRDGRWRDANDGGHRQQHYHRGGGSSRKRSRDDNNHLNSSSSNSRGAFRTLIDQVAERYKNDISTTSVSVPATTTFDAANTNRDDNTPQQSNSKLQHPEKTQQQFEQHQQQRHVALLFLTIDDLPHEHIWRMWLQSFATSSTSAPNNSDKDGTTTAAAQTDDKSYDSSLHEPPLRVSVLVHAKYPERIKSAWLKQFHLLRKSPQRQRQRQPKQYGGCDKIDISNRHNNDNSNKFSTAHNSGTTQSPPEAAAFHTRRPEWGSIEITRAMLDLLQAGLRIGQEHGSDNDNDEIFVNDNSNENDGDGGNNCIAPVDRFIFVSESCLPVVTLAEMEMALFGPRTDVINNNNNNNDFTSSSTSITPTTPNPSLYEKSWINAVSSPNNGYALQYQWNAILAANNNNNSGDSSSIPNNLIWKADQWVMLTRAHASAIISLPNKYLGGRQLSPEFRKCRASDEMYIPTALSILGILHRPNGIREVDAGTMGESCAGEYIRRRRITYADWSVSAKNPASFTCREWKEVVDKARKEGCLFARKFVRASSSPLSVRDGKEWKKQGGDRSHGNVNDNDLYDGLISVESWSTAVVGMKSGS